MKKMSINMGGATLLLVAFLSASLAAAARPSDNQEILMVVDKPLPLFPGGDDVEYGKFLLPDGKPLMLSRQRHQPGKLGCVGPGESCSPVTSWCCGSLTCSSSFGGTCGQEDSCTAAGGFCSLLDYNCCFPLRCDNPNQGTCVNPTLAP